MQPIFDNVEYLMNLSRSEKKAGRGYHELLDLGILEIEPLTYIRGRSIPNQFIIVDEAQNLTPHEVKTIITRVGDGTKIVLTGDPYQIDNPYVDQTNNGLIHVVNRFKNERLAGHITHAEGRAQPARRARGEPPVAGLQHPAEARFREAKRARPLLCRLCTTTTCRPLARGWTSGRRALGSAHARRRAGDARGPASAHAGVPAALHLQDHGAGRGRLRRARPAAGRRRARERRWPS